MGGGQGEECWKCLVEGCLGMIQVWGGSGGMWAGKDDLRGDETDFGWSACWYTNRWAHDEAMCISASRNAIMTGWKDARRRDARSIASLASLARIME